MMHRICWTICATLLAAPAAADTPAPPVEARFDPAHMPAPAAPTAPLGYRFAPLTPGQQKSLRRDFKLPLDALASVDSLRALRDAAVVAPLPDPSRPILAVGAPAGSGDPFTGEQTTSFRDDPMRALGEMLGATEEDAVVSGSNPFGTAATSSSDDPFGEPAIESPAAPAEESSADPFGESDDPFGAGDPFGF